MKLSRLNIKKINLSEVDNNYSGQDILMKLGELYQYESGIYGYGNLWTKLFQNFNQEKYGINQIDGIHIQKMEI